MNLAFTVNSFKNTEDSISLVRVLNQLAEENNAVSSFFIEWGNSLETKCFGNFLISDLFHFRGICISTNLETLKFALRAPKIKQNYLYLSTLEWTNSGNNSSYEEMWDLYCDDRVNLIVKSPEDFGYVKNCWKEPVAVWPSFEKDLILKLGE